MRVVWVALLTRRKLWIDLRRTVLLLLLLLLLRLVMVLRLGLRRKGILTAGILLLRRVQPHRSRWQRRIRVARFMLVRRRRSLMIEGLRWWWLLLLLLLRWWWCSIRARRGSLLEQRRREAASLTALVLTRRATWPGIVVEHIAEVHDGGAIESKNDQALSCLLLAGRFDLLRLGRYYSYTMRNLITHPGDGHARSECDSRKKWQSGRWYAASGWAGLKLSGVLTLQLGFEASLPNQDHGQPFDCQHSFTYL
jgi:hypothetical protein